MLKFLREYAECCADIRNFDTLVWQNPTLLTAIITFLGVLYAGYLNTNQMGRVLVLWLALIFSIVSLIAILKHRFFADKRYEHIKHIQEELTNLLKNNGFQGEYSQCKEQLTNYWLRIRINAQSIKRKRFTYN